MLTSIQLLLTWMITGVILVYILVCWVETQSLFPPFPRSEMSDEDLLPAFVLCQGFPEDLGSSVPQYLGQGAWSYGSPQVMPIFLDEREIITALRNEWQWQNIDIDDRSYDTDADSTPRSLLFGITIALFSTIGYDSVHILTARSPPHLDSGSHSTSNMFFQTTIGLIGPLSMLCIGLMSIGITWTLHELKKWHAVQSPRSVWSCNHRHKMIVGLWLFTSGVTFFYRDPSHKSAPNAIVVSMTLSLVFIWAIAAEARMRRLHERSYHPVRSTLTMPFVGNILVFLGHIIYCHSGSTPLFNRFSPPDLHVILGWRLLLLRVFFPLILAVPLIYLLPESPRWIIKPGHYEEAFHSLSRLRGERIVADSCLLYIHSQIDLEERDGRMESEIFLKHFQENPRATAQVGSMRIWQSVIPLALFALSSFR